MINIRNTSTLIAAIACAANALNLQSSASASATKTSISERDVEILRTGETLTENFHNKFRLTEGDGDEKDIQSFDFTLQDDGNLVLYRNDDGGRKAIWASDTNGEGDNLKLWLQEDGSLSLRDADTNDLKWSSYSGDRGIGPYDFAMPDPGFPMIVDSRNRVVWAADQTESFCNKTWWINEMLTGGRWQWNGYRHSETFGFERGNCGEPDWIIEGPFYGNYFKVYEEYKIEYEGEMVESTWLYIDETKLDYEGFYGLRSCQDHDHSGQEDPDINANCDKRY